MAYTADEIYQMSIAIMDELSESGTIDINQTKEYRYKAPRFLDMWQKKMAQTGNLFSTEEYANADSDSLNKWIKFSLPADMKFIKEIIFVNDDGQIGTIEYKRFGLTDIYFYFTETGTAKMLYIPIPAKITDLAQTLEVDEIVSIGGAYYLAELFAMSDMNTELATKCRNEFKELKKDSMIEMPPGKDRIIDVYASCGGDT